MKKILFAFACILALVFAMSITGFAATTESNAYADTLDVVEGVPEPSIIDENARAVVVVNGTYYTIPTYYLIADSTHFTWSVHANVKTALGLDSDVRGNIVRIEIPEGIETSVEISNGGAKFERSKTIIEASLPTSLKLMGEYFFSECSNLAIVNGLENTKITKIYGCAFNSCSSLTSITIPSTVTEIAFNAFRNAGITSIAIPDAVTTLGDHAFASCTSLATVTISQSSKLTTLTGNYHFEKTAITSFYFPSGLTSLGTEGMFFSCSSLTTLQNFESLKITDIPYRSFHGAPLTSLTLPETLESIGKYAISGHKIKQDVLVIPNGVETIGQCGIAGGYGNNDSGVGKLVLPAKLTTLDIFALEKMKFSEIYLSNTVKQIPEGVFNSWPSDYVVYFTGTQTEAETLRANTSTANNKNWDFINNTTLKSVAEYGAPTTISGRTIVYGYSACEAFYNGVHNEADAVNGSACYLKDCSRCDAGELYIGGDINSGKHSLTVAYEYANGYMQDGQIVSICGNAGCTHGTNDTAFTSPLKALFNGLLYSIAENGTGICVKYNVDKEAIENYKESGKEISFGVVAIMSDKIGDGDVLNADGTKKTTSNVVLADLTNEGVSSVTLKIVSSKETWVANNAKSIYLLGYATNGEALEYLGEANEGVADRDNIASVKSVLISNYFPTPQEGGNA